MNTTPTELVKRPEVHRTENRINVDRQQRNNQEAEHRESTTGRCEEISYVDSSRNVCNSSDSSDKDEWHNVSDSDWETK